MLNKKKQRLVNLFTYAVLILFSIYCVFPFIWMVVTSLKPENEIMSVKPSLFIKEPTIDTYKNLLFNTDFVIYFKNSFIVALSTTLIAIVISVLAGYALSRYNKQKMIASTNFCLTLAQMIPGVLLLIPLYLIMQKLNLLDTYWSMIIAYTTFVVPLCTFMIKGFLDTIPYELEEAAQIDGCRKIGIILRIILPVSFPSIFSTGIFAFVNSWNEFMFGYTFINSDIKRTLTPAVTLFKGAHTTDWGGIMTVSVLAVLPILIVFIYLQKFLVAGVTAGSVKG